MKENANCGVRVAEGAHRAYVTDFIRDARAGGCASGVPPNNLGFRLVREPKSWISRAALRLALCLSMIFSGNRFPPRIACGAGFFRIML